LLQASEIPVPADDEGLVDLTTYDPFGHAAELLSVRAFFVAKDTGSQPSWQRGVYTLGINTATYLRLLTPTPHFRLCRGTRTCGGSVRRFAPH